MQRGEGVCEGLDFLATWGVKHGMGDLKTSSSVADGFTAAIPDFCAPRQRLISMLELARRLVPAAVWCLARSGARWNGLGLGRRGLAIRRMLLVRIEVGCRVLRLPGSETSS